MCLALLTARGRQWYPAFSHPNTAEAVRYSPVFHNGSPGAVSPMIVSRTVIRSRLEKGPFRKGKGPLHT